MGVIPRAPLFPAGDMGGTSGWDRAHPRSTLGAGLSEHIPRRVALHLDHGSEASLRSAHTVLNLRSFLPPALRQNGHLHVALPLTRSSVFLALSGTF